MSLSTANIRLIEGVLMLEPLELKRFLSRLSPGAQGLLENLLDQYEQRLK